MGIKSLFNSVIIFFKKFFEVYESISVMKFSAPIYRDLKNEDDLFMLLCFCDILGVPNPVSFYTLELYPEFFSSFHEWHKSMGMERSPLDHIRCC